MALTLLDRFEEGTALIPETQDGVETANFIHDLLRQVREEPQNDFERAVKMIRNFFAKFNIIIE
jgi:hypothetical protein